MFEVRGKYTTAVDEAPDAYKPWEPIMELVADTMEIDTRLKPILNLKSG